MNKAMREGFVDDNPVTAGNGSDGQHETAPEAPVDPVAAAPAAPAIDVWPVTVKLLHKEIRNNKNEMVNEVVFREPSAMDIIRSGGNPCRLDNNMEVIIDDAKMMRLMANLSGIMEPFLQRMDPRDYNSCAYRLRNFFLPEVAAWM